MDTCSQRRGSEHPVRCFGHFYVPTSPFLALPSLVKSFQSCLQQIIFHAAHKTSSSFVVDNACGRKVSSKFGLYHIWCVSIFSSKASSLRLLIVRSSSWDGSRAVPESPQFRRVWVYGFGQSAPRGELYALRLYSRLSSMLTVAPSREGSVIEVEQHRSRYPFCSGWEKTLSMFNYHTSPVGHNVIVLTARIAERSR